MEHLNSAVGHSRLSIMGTCLALVIGFIGKIALSDATLIMGLLSGAATFAYTIWKFYNEWRKERAGKKHSQKR